MDHATFWADTMQTGPSGPAGHALKLAINPLARVIGVGAGMVAVLREGDRAVLEHDTLEAIIPAVAAALRAAAMRVAGRRGERQTAWFARNVYAVAGWSIAEERVLAYQFPADELFEPHPIALLACPDASIPFHGLPLTPNQVNDAASRQAALLREAGQAVGLLTVATLTARGIVAMAPEEIAPPPVPVAGVDADPASSIVEGGEAGEASHPYPLLRRSVLCS